MIKSIDKIWMHSHYYGDMVSTTIRLHQTGEDYAAVMILFNSMELILKSVRENFFENFFQDLADLKNKELLTQDEYSFLDDKENGIRKIRNIMTHRDAYQYCFDNQDGNVLPFSETETWTIVYNSYAPRIVRILANVIERKNRTT